MTDRDDVAGLAGRAFSVTHGRDEIVEYAFADLAPGADWPKVGREGIVTPVTRILDEDDERASVMKHFHVDAPERASRAKHLIDTGLGASHEWMFQGLPYAWLDEMECAGVTLYGQVSRRVGAEFGAPAASLEDLLLGGDWDEDDEDEKRRLAAHVAQTVALLEQYVIVHGDLSADNVMIGPGPDGRDAAVLVDYDSFFAPDADPLPRKVDGQIVHPLGTPGYRAPALMAAIAADPDGENEALAITSDRFALAVLICEMAAWTRADAERRGRLLSEEMTRARSLEALEPEVRARFPEGFDLLARALATDDPGEMASANEWDRLLADAPIPAPYVAPIQPPAPAPVEDAPRRVVPAPPTLDAEIIDPELERVAAAEEAHLPAPTDEVLLEPGDPHGERFAPFPFNPMVRVAKITGRDIAQRRPGRLRSPEGHFGPVDSRLTVVRFRRLAEDEGGGVVLNFDWPHPVWRRAAGGGGRLVRHDPGGDIRVGRGDKLASHGWRFHVIDESDLRL